MQIIGTEGLSTDQINDELERGGRFVTYQFCISVIILTFKRSSKIFFIKSGESRVTKGLQYTLISFFFGWWGFPWGPVYTIGSFITNFGGGNDITMEVVDSFNQVGSAT